MLGKSTALAIIIFLFFQLLVFNLGINWRDEGYLIYNGIRINQGEIPYRDFFLTTTPGSFYIQAFLMKVFGNQLIIGRWLYIAFVILMILFVSKVFDLNFFWHNLVLISLVLIFVTPGGFAFYNLEGLTMILIALWLLKKAVSLKSLKYVFGVGLVSAITLIIKQSYGAMIIPAFLLIIVFYSDYEKRLRYIIGYLGGVTAVLTPFFIYFYVNGSFPQLIHYIFFFAQSVKSHQASFIFHRLVFIPLFIIFLRLIIQKSIKIKVTGLVIILILGGIYFISSPARVGRLVDYLFDPLFYFYSIIFILPLLIIGLNIRPRNDEQKHLVMNSIVLLGLFLASASSGYDYTTVAIVSPLFVPLIIKFVTRLGEGYKFKQVLMLLVTGLVAVYTTILSFNDFSPGGKVYGVYSKQDLTEILNLPETKYIRVSRENKEELEFLVSYIKKHVSFDGKIFCFPYCPMMNVLAQRNSASYYSFFYFETFMEKDQRAVIADLQFNQPSIILIQKKGDIEPEAGFEDDRLDDLKSFIIEKYKEELETKNFKIYSD